MVSCFIPSKLHPLIFSACEKEAKKISAWQRMVSSGEILETMGNYRGENKRREKEKKGKTSFLSTLFQFYSVLKTELETGKYESPHYFLVIQFSLYFPSEPNRRTLFFSDFIPFPCSF